MSRRGYAIVTLVAACLFATLFVAVALLAPRPRLIWNATASAPLGLYRVMPAARPETGALVVVMPPPHLARFLDGRRYLALGVPLLKHVAAQSGARLCRHGARVSVNGRTVAIARIRDSHRRLLPVWRGCRVLGRHELFLINHAADSMDGRYFGAVPDNGLLGRAIPILTRDAPTAPLRWRGSGAPYPTPQPNEEISHADR